MLLIETIVTACELSTRVVDERREAREFERDGDVYGEYDGEWHEDCGHYVHRADRFDHFEPFLVGHTSRLKIRIEETKTLVK